MVNLNKIKKKMEYFFVGQKVWSPLFEGEGVVVKKMDNSSRPITVKTKNGHLLFSKEGYSDIGFDTNVVVLSQTPLKPIVNTPIETFEVDEGGYE